jgi:hypothetical protein
VPPDAVPGLYGVRAMGDNALGIKRFVAVR